jgi:acyl-coenzyme A thioesterase PaaI-like protein
MSPDFVKHKPKVFLDFYWNESEQYLTGSVFFGPEAEGPPGGAHGASVALVFDEILAYPVWRTGETAFTVSLTTKFLRMMPLNKLLRFHSRIVSHHGRKFLLAGKIEDPETGTVHASGQGLWLQSKGISTIAMRSFL